MDTKTVYFIRHAESDENRRLASLGRCFKKLGSFSLPSSADIYASTQLLNVPAQIDSNVSDIGKEQIDQMAKTLKDDDFVRAKGIQLVVHSPLLRAQQTSEGMLGCRAEGMKAETVDRVVELELLSEKTLEEWTPVYYNGFKLRMASFEDWLGEQSEQVVAIVGHSQYFRAMLGVDFKFGNCDVWMSTFDISKRGPADASGEVKEEKEDSTFKTFPQWQDLQQVYKCSVEGSAKKEEL